MSKRKRDDPSPTTEKHSSSGPKHVQEKHNPTRLRQKPIQTHQHSQNQLSSTIENGQKAVFRALKVARGFERQKLGRRQKKAVVDKDEKKKKKEEDAKEEDDDDDEKKDTGAGEESELGRLGVEVRVLKGLNLASIAELHVHKTLSKVKSIAMHPAFVLHVRTHVQASSNVAHDAAYANVTARLYSSKLVKETVQAVVDTVYGILGLESRELRPKKRLRAKDFKDVGDVNDNADALLAKGVELGHPPSNYSRVTSGSPQWDGFSDPQVSEEDGVEGGEDTSTEKDDEEYRQYVSRLASTSSEAESGDESEDRSAEWPKKPRYSSVSDTALSPSPSISQPDQSLSNVTSKTSKSSKSVHSTNVKSTTFLPTLMGGYYSGSESDSVDSDDDTNHPKPRKNRMGQQARRQLWEKKFGQKANHVKIQSRDQGWDPRKGAQGDEDRGKRGRHMEGNTRTTFGRGQQTSGANSDPIQARKKPKVAEGPLHPSWEAAKKAKEQKVTAVFEGKKIVFD